MSQVIEVELPDEFPTDLSAELRLAAAVKWYEIGRLSQGKAAEVAGLSRAEFIDALGRFSVSAFQETAAEIAQGVRRFER